MVDVNITADITEVMKTFKKHIKNNPKLMKKLVRSAVNLGKSVGKKNTYKGVKKKSGNLRKSFISKIKSNTEGYIVNRASYASGLEFGKVIKPKHKKYLTFQIDDGEWVKLSSVTIKAKLGFTKTMERLFASTEPTRRMETVLEKELEKLYK